ncbi:MAG TPA: hypothetical protein VMU39_16725 [Solirubrobacteraceae bacterium]|nr:hypothetical protein [Solirubrobacteraceae bacterium]
MRRKIIILTALCTLFGASAAYAALNNNYKGTTQTFTKGVGTKAKPVGIGFTQTLVAQNTDLTKAAAVLTNITTKIYGLVADGKDFPTCDPNKMVTLKSDSFCKPKSKFAHGSVNSLLGDPTLLLTSRTKCNPGLDVFNGGQGKVWFFFTTSSPLDCASLKTGDTAPYKATVSQQKGYEIINVPLPADISTKVANHADFYGSLIKEQLNWFKVSTKVKGKTVYNNASIGCLKGKRPWSITYTATPDGGLTHETQTITGSAPC